MTEALQLIIVRSSYLLSIIIVLMSSIFFASDMLLTGFFTALAGLLIAPASEQITNLKIDDRFLGMSILLVIGAFFMPSLNSLPYNLI